MAARALADFGIAPVPLTISDVLAGLQTGLIDTVAAPLVGAVALQWHGPLKYVLDLPFMYIFAPMVLVKRPFERLEPEDRAVVRKVLGAAVRDADARNRRDHDAVRKVLQGQGLRFLQPVSRRGAGVAGQGGQGHAAVGRGRCGDGGAIRTFRGPSGRVQGQAESLAWNGLCGAWSRRSSSACWAP